MINAIIVDDETKSREILQELLTRYCPDVRVIGTADSIKPAEELINAMKPDLVFLDVEMPFGNGFDLLEKFEKINFEIVFITAYDHYALKAIKFSALDYLLKPVDIDDLENALSKVDEKLKNKKGDISQQVQTFLSSIKSKDKTKKIGIPSSDGIAFVNVADIVRCESDVNYTNIYFKDKTKITVPKTLKEYEDMLTDYNFFRVHNSTLINMDHVKQYLKGNGGFVVMTDGKEVEVSRRKKAEFLQKIEAR